MVKITVVKKAYFEDIVVQEQSSLGNFQACERFSEGQEFILDSIGKMPEDFCAWAWADIHRDIVMIEYGAQPPPKLTNPHSIYSCCTEGLRPVVFRIEKLQ